MEDLRIIKTKKSLYDSLLKLMSSKEFEDIKVIDICENALVNRSTFYSHFNDKYELLYSFISDLRQSLKEDIIKNRKFNTTKEYYMCIISSLLDHIDNNINTYSLIIKNNQYSIVMNMLTNTIIEDINKELKKIENSEIPSMFVTNFYIGAIVNIGINYLKNPNKYSKEKIIVYLNKLLPENI